MFLAINELEKDKGDNDMEDKVVVLLAVVDRFPDGSDKVEVGGTDEEQDFGCCVCARGEEEKDEEEVEEEQEVEEGPNEDDDGTEEDVTLE